MGTKAEERKIGFVVGPLRESIHPLVTSLSFLLRGGSRSTGLTKHLNYSCYVIFPGDPRHPYAHIHLHAVKGPWDLASYYRKAMVYNFVGWYELEDLIAEIR